MLRILNKDKQAICGLDRYQQLRVTKRLQFDDKTLEFTALIADIANLENEGYIETETDRFVIKEIKPSSNGTADVLAQLDVETLEGKTFIRFETVEKTLSEAMAIVFAGTGWTVGTCEITKRRTLRKENCTAFDMLKQALSVYRCECKIDTKEMTVSFYEEIGSDRGVYFMSDLNLRSLSVSRTSYDFYTEIEPYGAEGMTIEEVNDGSKVLTNYTYSSKRKRIIWKDERYTVPESLMEDAQAKLNDYSKPYVSYMADVVDLASMTEDYSILEYDIGDTITLADDATGTREKQRIVEMVVYPEQPEMNSCVFANTTLTFEELASKFNETADTVDNITIDNGTVDGNKVDKFDATRLYNFDTVLSSSGVFGDLAANFATFEDATVSRLNAAEANITNLQTNYANVAIARIGVLETDYGNIRDLLAGNAAATQAEMIHLNAQNAMIDTAFLKNLIALNITANDLKAGTIYTNKHTVMSEDGAMVMTGSLLTFKDASGNVRIQIGKDGQGNYNYYLVNADGDIIWNAAGITADGIADGLIVDDMVADSDGTYQGISASKLNIHSMVGALNSEGGLRSSSIVMDEDNQSLSVAFTNLKSDVENISVGGRNLIKNTLNPDVSSEENYPKLVGQTANTTTSAGTKTIATHGFRLTNTSSARTYVRFGSSNTTGGTMNGLVAGETYTLSFDASMKLFSGSTPAADGYLRLFVYYTKTASGSYTYKYFDLCTVSPDDSGVEISRRCEATFTIPETAKKIYLHITPSLGSAVFYAAGDYIELRNLKLEKGNKSTDWTPAPEDYLAETAKLNDLIDGIQDQIDGVIDTYYYDYAPTLSNVPASDWAAADYPSHKGDMFLDTSTGKSYRFLQDETTQTWSWVEIPDTASAAALVAAQNAADLADHKRRVFVATPTVPYDVGDLWFTGTGGDILTCTTAKTTNQSYAQADWSKLHKYTDDTYATNRYSELTTTIDGITGRVGTLETTTTEHGQTLTSHTTTISQTANKINRIITDSQISELDTGTSMFDKLLSVEETADSVQTDVSSLKTWKNTATGQISSMESTQSTFRQDLTGTQNRLTTLQTTLEDDYSTTAETQTLISTSRTEIIQSVSSTYATKTDTVNAVTIEYAKGTSQTTAPTSGWSTASPTWESGKYIWQRTAITKNGQTSYSNVSCIQGAKGQDGQDGEDGQDGQNGTSVSILSTEIKYQAHTSGTSAPTGTWQDTVPTVAQGSYLWTRTKVNYSDGTSTTAYAVARMGANGSNGTDGTSPTATSTVTKYQQSTSGTTTPTGTWQTTPPTATAGQYMWTQTTVTYSDGATAVSYSVSKNGEKGDTGVGIREVIPRYCLWTSDTNPPSDSYSDPTYGWFENKKPDWAEGRYIWIQTKIVYDDDTVANPHVEYTTAICDTTLNSLESRVYKAELKITDDAIISTVSASYGIADANLIYNSTGFGGSTDGWALSSTSANYELFADYESTRPGKTDYALGYRIKTTSTTTVYMRQTAEHNIPVVQGKQYTLSGFYYRGSNVKTGCQIGIEYGNNGSGWTSTNSADYNVSMTATGAWTAFSLTFTAPKNTVRVAIKGAGSSSTSANNVIYVCDLVLVRGTETMPWAEQPVSLIQQSADMIRLQAEKLVWVANNSSLTEAGYLTVTGGQIGGFEIDTTAIRNLANTSTANGAVLLSTADVSRTIAGVPKSDVRFAIGSNMGVTKDGTIYASNGHFSGEITSTTGNIGGLIIHSGGIASDNTYTDSGYLMHDYLKINKTGEIIIYSSAESLTEETPSNADIKFHLNRKGKLWVSEFGNDYWNVSGNALRGRYTGGAAYYITLNASSSDVDSSSGWAMSLTDSTGSARNFILRYSGAVECTALTVTSLTSGTGSAVVANSSGRLYITSSSKRYKDYIADMTESEAEKLYDLPVVQFKYKDGYLDREDEAYDKPLHGFFAEDVAEMFSDGGIHNAAGDVENYSERAIIARLVKLVQMQHREIESLKASMQS